MFGLSFYLQNLNLSTEKILFSSFSEITENFLNAFFATDDVIKWAVLITIYYLKNTDQTIKNPATIQLSINLDESFYGNSQVENFKNLKKTGLGSSAVVTVLTVSSLLCQFIEQKNYNPSLHLIFAISSIAHNFSQKKVGSGFDISAAVWGSQLFKKCSPSNIILQSDKESEIVDFIQNYTLYHRENFDKFVQKFNFSSHLYVGLIYDNHNFGTKTTSQVSLFNKWKLLNQNFCSKIFSKIAKKSLEYFEMLENVDYDSKKTKSLSKVSFIFIILGYFEFIL